MRTEPHQVELQPNIFQHLTENWTLSAQQIVKSFGELGWVLRPPPPPQQIICKGRYCSLHSMRSLLASSVFEQQGWAKSRGRDGDRGRGCCCCRQAPLLSISGYPSPLTWGCGRHGDGLVLPGGAERQPLPLPSPVSIPQRSPGRVLLRPGRSPALRGARQQQVLGVRRG